MPAIGSFLGYAVDRSRTVLSLFVLIMFAGIVSYITIPIESQPDVSVPIIVITIPH